MAGGDVASVTDCRGVAIALDGEPQRIVSLVPSDSYTLAALGAVARMVGRTQYCVDPAALDAVEMVGGTKNADVARIVALAPDLVVANLEENRQIDIERLERAGVAVYVSFPKTVAEGLNHARCLAELMPSLDNHARLAEADALLARLSRAGARPRAATTLSAMAWAGLGRRL